MPVSRIPARRPGKLGSMGLKRLACSGWKGKPQVEEIKDAKPRKCKRVGAKREQGDALVIKSE